MAMQAKYRSYKTYRTYCAAGLALIVVTVSACASEAPHYAGQPVQSVLESLRGQGLKLIYSSALVTPEMKVAGEPAGQSAREILDRVLEPLGLHTAPGPNESFAIVKGLAAG